MCTCVEVLEDKRPVAKQDYTCGLKEEIQEWISGGLYCGQKVVDRKIVYLKLTFSEMRMLVKARRENFKILAGTKYVYQRNKMDGSIYTWRAREDMYKLANKYKLFPDC